MKRILKKLSFTIVFFSFVFGFNNLVCATETDENVVLESVPKLSIIMPVYNVAPYLDEALDSAENQTYKDLEIICVNDGSTDNSLEILESHAKKDSRIKIISQENQGLSGARNTGMRVALGEYIYFFDSDDILAPHAMEKAVENLEKYNADASEFKHIRFECNSHIDMSEYPYKELPVEVLECSKNQNPFETIGARPISACFRVYRKSFLKENRLVFKKKLRIMEDVLFNYFSRAGMKKLVKDSNVGYFYRVKRPGSIMNTDFKLLEKRLDGEFMIMRELVRNRNRFKFPNSDKYLVQKMLERVYICISNIKDEDQKRLYAGRAYEEIWKNFAKKYSVNLDDNSKNELINLKYWSEYEEQQGS